jgi:hypothetical protein
MSNFSRKATPVEFAQFVAASQEKLSSLGLIVDPAALDKLIQEAVVEFATDCFIDVEPYFSTRIIDLPEEVDVSVAVVRDEQEFDLAIGAANAGKPVYLYIRGDITPFRPKLVSSCDQEKVGAVFFSFASRFEPSLSAALNTTPVFFATCFGHALAVVKLLVASPYQAVSTALNCDEVVLSLSKNNPS